MTYVALGRRSAANLLTRDEAGRCPAASRTTFNEHPKAPTCRTAHFQDIDHFSRCVWENVTSDVFTETGGP
jgi:hypothetical protein